MKVVDKVFDKIENIPSSKNLNEIEYESTVLHMQASETAVVRFQLFTEEVQDRCEFGTEGGDAGSRAHIDTWIKENRRTKLQVIWSIKQKRLG